MKTPHSLLALGLALSLGAAQAADTTATAEAPKAKTAQQTKMVTCNKDAKDKALKGDERKAFMKECLSAKHPEAAAAVAAASASAGTPQQEKMKNCNTEAKDKGLKGDERKKHMSECLKK